MARNSSSGVSASALGRMVIGAAGENADCAACGRWRQRMPRDAVCASHAAAPPEERLQARPEWIGPRAADSFRLRSRLKPLLQTGLTVAAVAQTRLAIALAKDMVLRSE